MGKQHFIQSSGYNYEGMKLNATKIGSVKDLLSKESEKLLPAENGSSKPLKHKLRKIRENRDIAPQFNERIQRGHCYDSEYLINVTHSRCNKVGSTPAPACDNKITSLL